MSESLYSLHVLGVDIAFKPGANMERARLAAEFVEERFEAQKLKSEGSPGKDMLLTFLALGLADELLQMKAGREQTTRRLEALLDKIEKSL